MQAYCMKCRVKREMANPVRVTMKNGKPATKGSCPVCGALFQKSRFFATYGTEGTFGAKPVCGTKMFRIGRG